MGQPTAKITIEARPDVVEALTRQLREILEVSYESKDKSIQSRPDDVRRYLRVVPAEVAEQVVE